MEAVARDPITRARTIFDLVNEPDVRAMRWEAYTNSSDYHIPSVADIYHQMLDIGYAINPSTHCAPATCQIPRRPKRSTSFRKNTQSKYSQYINPRYTLHPFYNARSTMNG